MSDPIPTPTPTKPSSTPTNPKPPTLDWSKAEENITSITKHLSTFEGVPGHNPFIYYNNKVKPLVERYQQGEKSEELHKAMLALVKEAPETKLFDEPIRNIIGLPKNKF